MRVCFRWKTAQTKSTHTGQQRRCQDKTENVIFNLYSFDGLHTKDLKIQISPFVCVCVYFFPRFTLAPCLTPAMLVTTRCHILIYKWIERNTHKIICNNSAVVFDVVVVVVVIGGVSSRFCCFSSRSLLVVFIVATLLRYISLFFICFFFFFLYASFIFRLCAYLNGAAYTFALTQNILCWRKLCSVIRWNCILLLLFAIVVAVVVVVVLALWTECSL